LVFVVFSMLATSPQVFAQPGSFNLIFPENDGTIEDSTPTFRWENAPGATNYRIVIDNDPDLGSPLYDNGNLGNVTTFALPLENALPVAGIYYWGIRAENADGYTWSSENWRFHLRAWYAVETWSGTVTIPPPKPPPLNLSIILLGVVLVFVPGFLFSVVLYPKAGRLDFWSRVGLSFGLGIVVVIYLAFFVARLDALLFEPFIAATIIACAVLGILVILRGGLELISAYGKNAFAFFMKIGSVGDKVIRKFRLPKIPKLRKAPPTPPEEKPPAPPEEKPAVPPEGKPPEEVAPPPKEPPEEKPPEEKPAVPPEGKPPEEVAPPPEEPPEEKPPETPKSAPTEGEKPQE
jgi:hypothetical protein